MAVSPRFAEYVLEQLGGLRALRSNRMFNGVGLYSDGVFFAVLHEDTLYFKTGESNIAAYRDRGMAKFTPFPDRPGTTLGYHQVPADVLEDAETLVEWAREAVKVQLEKQTLREKKPAARKRKPMVPRKKPAPKGARKSAAKKKSPRKKSSRR